MTTRAEMETIIRWNRETDVATLYTADPCEVRRWRALGYDVEVCGVTHEGKARGWQTAVPIAAVALLALRSGRVQIPRWLEPPVVREAAVKAQGSGDSKKPREIPEENRAECLGHAQTVAGVGRT